MLPMSDVRCANRPNSTNYFYVSFYNKDVNYKRLNYTDQLLLHISSQYFVPCVLLHKRHIHKIDPSLLSALGVTTPPMQTSTTVVGKEFILKIGRQTTCSDTTSTMVLCGVKTLQTQDTLDQRHFGTMRLVLKCPDRSAPVLNCLMDTSALVPNCLDLQQTILLQ